MKKIDINDKTIVNGYLSKYQIVASELSFTNLYAWRNKYQFHYMILNDYLWIINIKNDVYYLSQPIGDYRTVDEVMKSIDMMKNYLGQRPFVVKKADQRFIDLMLDSDYSFEYKSIRDDFDYLYDFEKMQTFSGNKYHKKKNHINQFMKKYDWTYEVLNRENIHHVKAICDHWFAEDDTAEQDAIYDVMNHLGKLDVSGGILYIEDKPVSFIIGELLNDETLVVHFEKGVRGYHGVYPMVFHEYLKRKTGFKYVNREQDLGIIGLRKSKLSYHPVSLIKKYNIIIK